MGSLAHMTVFSFHPVKHVTTGEGGMVTTSDAKFADRSAAFATTGSAAMRVNASPRDSGTTKWCCSVSTTG